MQGDEESHRMTDPASTHDWRLVHYVRASYYKGAPPADAEEIHRCRECGWHRRSGRIVKHCAMDKSLPESMPTKYWNEVDTCEEAQARHLIGSVLDT